METHGYITGILHHAVVDDARLDRCARDLGEARVTPGLLASWTFTCGDLEVRISGIRPDSASTCVLMTSMRTGEDALAADWAAFEPIFRALCVVTEPSHAHALLFVDDDGRPKAATPEELRWHTLAPDAWPAVLPARSYFGAPLRAIAPISLTTIAEPLGGGLYLEELGDRDAETLATAFGGRMRPIGARFAVLRRTG